MWKFLANKILRNRIAFIVVLLLLTVFMAYKALNIKLSYEFVRVLPTTDPAYVEYENFKQKFGEDGSVMVIGLQTVPFFK